jgi:hypothetical protein
VPDDADRLARACADVMYAGDRAITVRRSQDSRVVAEFRGVSRTTAAMLAD